MASVSNRAELELEVVSRHKQGISRRQIAKELHISRNTVRKILCQHHRHREEGHDILQVKRPALRPSKLDEYVPKIQALLSTYPNATGQRIYEELRAKGYQGGISILREKLRQLRPKPKSEPVVRFETDPGEQGQMDWSPYRLKLKDGSRLQVVCFSYVLGFSRRQYIDFCLRRDFYTLIRRHQQAFSYFGGVPEHCLYDSEKTVVLRWEANQPIFNPAFLQFITHYDCRPVACARGRAKTKGKVEAPFQYVENNLLNARTFEGLDDLRSTARWWLANRSDPHIHDTTHRAPLELFLAEEASALQPLPRHPYDTSEVGFRVCNMDGFIDWVSNRYSVPYEHVGDIMTVKASETEVIVYSPEIKEVARHERLADSANNKSELAEHRAGAKQVRYGLAPVKERFIELGAATEDFLIGLVRKYPRNCGYHARRILLLKETYNSGDIHRALVHAMRYQAYDCQAVERILSARYRPRTLESLVGEKSSQHLRQALPPIQQRSLAEYQFLLEPQAGPDNTHEAADTTKESDNETTSPEAEAEALKGGINRDAETNQGPPDCPEVLRVPRPTR
jgi:transposase